MAAAKKDYTPQPFEALITDPAALLFVDLKKDWIAVANLDAIKYELKADGGVKNNLKIERAADGKVSGQIEMRLPACTAAALEPVITADTKRKLKVAVSQANKIVPGLKATATIEALLDKHTQDLKLAFDYKRANLAAKVEFTLPVDGYVPNVSGATAATKNSVVLGAAKDAHEVNLGVEFDYSLARSFVKAFNVLFTYRNTLPGGWMLAGYSRQTNVEDTSEPSKAVVKKDKHVCGLMVHQKFAKLVGSNAEVAGQLEYNLTKKADNTSLAIAFAFDAATDSRVHVKMNTQNQFNFVLTQKANAATTLKAGVDVSGDAVAVTRGFVELSLSA